jgi:hypothetical protein
VTLIGGPVVGYSGLHCRIALAYLTPRRPFRTLTACSPSSLLHRLGEHAMTDDEYKLAIAQKLLTMEEKIDMLREALDALNDQQLKMNRILQNWCKGMEAEVGKEDPWGLFRSDED